jgi:hypothetical protein
VTRFVPSSLAEFEATLAAGPVRDLAFVATSNGNPMTKESLGIRAPVSP